MKVISLALVMEASIRLESMEAAPGRATTAANPLLQVVTDLQAATATLPQATTAIQRLQVARHLRLQTMMGVPPLTATRLLTTAMARRLEAQAKVIQSRQQPWRRWRLREEQQRWKQQRRQQRLLS